MLALEVLDLEVLNLEMLNLELLDLEDLCFAASALLGTGLRLIAKALLEEGALGAVLVAVAVEGDALALGGVAAAAAAAIVAAVAVREVVAINEVNEPDSTAAYRVV